jgi:hypothetical protein
MPIMKKLILLATIAILPLFSTHPAFAQAAISEPGLYSFYHPGGDLAGVGARQIRPGAEPSSASPSNAFALSRPRATVGHRHPRSRRAMLPE